MPAPEDLPNKPKYRQSPERADQPQNVADPVIEFGDHYDAEQDHDFDTTADDTL